MKNEEIILHEIQELKALVARLIGTNNLPKEQQFSTDALNKAEEEFKKLTKARDEWIDEDGFEKYLKADHYDSGKFVRQEFGFTSYYKKGYDYYYNKKDILAFSKELKNRNIDLNRYIELKKDQAEFEKTIAAIRGNTPLKSTAKPFHIPPELRDILTSPAKRPNLDVMKDALQKLKDEFYENNFSDYIDIYKDNYAMVKSIYHFEKYLDPKIKRRIFRWCSEFNVVQRIMEEITQKKAEKFVPVPESKMIRL